jgi:hypothetical protein
VSSAYFIDKSLEEANKVINEALRQSGYKGSLLDVGKLKDIEDFDLK